MTWTDAHVCTDIDIWLICCREECATFSDLPTVPGQGSCQGDGEAELSYILLNTPFHCFAAGVCSL